MNKYHILIILNILILCVILLQYFGIIRYIKLHLNSTEYYIEKFKNLKSYKDNKLSVFVKTDKDNLPKLKPLINSLLDQTIKINELNLIVKIKNESDYNNLDIPKYISLTSNIIPSYNSEDNLNTLFTHEKSKNTIVFNLDDKKVYGKDYIEHLLSEYNCDDDYMVRCDNDMIIQNSDNIDNVKKVNYNENYGLIF